MNIIKCLCVNTDVQTFVNPHGMGVTPVLGEVFESSVMTS